MSTATTGNRSAGTKNDFDERAARLFFVADELFNQRPTWTLFFREILGPTGVARSVFTNEQDWQDFQTSEYRAAIDRMTDQLREQPHPELAEEPTQTITVRLPKSLHEVLKAEAHERCTSMNKLCISKLTRPIVAFAE